MPRIAASAIAVWGLLTSAACGGGGGYGGGSTPTNPAPSNTTTTVTINIMGVRGQQSFSPNPASVAAGQQVIFKNTDTVMHRVVLDDRSIDTGDIAPGASSQPVALGAVSKAYHCTVHPNMVGSLNSAATPDPPPCTGYCPGY